LRSSSRDIRRRRRHPAPDQVVYALGEDGRSPEPPDPAYQQIPHGVPAADFSADELLYLPRNPRAPGSTA
jgi:hypothetical protein